MTFKRINTYTGWHMIAAIFALALGGFLGLFQVLDHAGINAYPALNAVGIQSYYHGLTLHGVLNALVFTTFFITGFLNFVTSYALKREPQVRLLNVGGFMVMLIGLLMATVPLLLNQATVLFTFYPPLQASPFFYIGLTLVVVGSWVCGWAVIATWSGWRKANPGVQTPIVALGAMVTVVLWQICTIGLAIEMLTMLIPWSLGLIPGIDPQLARTFFWFTGHPLVYFWLLPAYISWYGMMPKQAGGKLFSEPLARLAFFLFLVLSTPLGFHHQYTDPGIPVGWKYIHAVLTYSVFFPSVLTAFNVAASLEIGGRARGGTGLLGWIRKLPWGDPSYAAQNLAMILFAFGGISGLTNASYSVNLAVHNTMWIPGHFHLTVGTATALSFIGISYWLIPKITGRNLFSIRLGVAQAWTWFFGMLLMSNALHIIGLRFQVPRRMELAGSAYIVPEMLPFLTEELIGGVILVLSGLLWVINMVGTVWFAKRSEVALEVPLAEAADPAPAPAWLDRWRPWLAWTFALILIGYGPQLFIQVSQAQFLSPGFRLW
jgi:cytochrome c oxidase subunit I